MPKQLMTQFCVPVESRPEKLYRVIQILSREGINIIGIMMNSALIRVLVDRENRVHTLLENAGMGVLEAKVFPLQLPDRPGELNRLLKNLGQAGIGVLSLYGTGSSGQSASIILEVDKSEKARPIVARWMEEAYSLP